MIRAPRLSVAIVAFVGAGLGVLASCRDPTEIVVDVLTDDCAQLRDTGISVAASLDLVATAEPKTLSPYMGCEAPPDRVGSVTIYPSGAHDAAVAFKVTTGVLRPAALCEANQNVGCIVVSRTANFVPATSQHMVVRMSRKCLDVACPSGTVCADGLCVRESDIGANGTAVPDAGVAEGGTAGDAAPSDASAADAAAANCAKTCVAPAGGPAMSCNSAGVCMISCTTAAPCGTTNLCPSGVACDITCSDSANCSALVCISNVGCKIHCDHTPPAKAGCGTVTCSGAACDVTCTGGKACGVAQLSGTTNTLTCTAKDACAAGSSCTGTTCTLVCGSNCPANWSCGAPTICTTK